MTLAVVYTFLLFTFKEVKLARSVVSKAEIERAKGIILGIPRSQVTEEGQTVVIYDNPSQAVADEMGCAFSRARHIISKLSEEGLLTYIANGGPAKPNGRRGHAWLVKLPDNGQSGRSQPEQQLELELNKPGWVDEFVNTIDKIQQFLDALRDKVVQVAEEARHTNERAAQWFEEHDRLKEERDAARAEAEIANIAVVQAKTELANIMASLGQLIGESPSD
jgi:uncharacterized protein YukE